MKTISFVKIQTDHSVRYVFLLHRYNFPRVCTYDTVCSHGKPLTDLDALPGQKFNLTEQCQLFIDPTSTYNNCVSIFQSSSDFESIILLHCFFIVQRSSVA